MNKTRTEILEKFWDKQKNIIRIELDFKKKKTNDDKKLQNNLMVIT